MKIPEDVMRVIIYRLNCAAQDSYCSGLMGIGSSFNGMSRHTVQRILEEELEKIEEPACLKS